MAENIIARVRDYKEQLRDVSAIKGIMLHRCGANLKAGLVIGHDAETICDAFTGQIPQWESVAQVTGYQNAYTFYVGGSLGPDDLDGKVWQTLPIDEVGYHGRRFSNSHIGIACIGDFRVKPPSARQWRAVLDLCADLCLMLGMPPSAVIGHGEAPRAHGGHKAPGQKEACPGDLFSCTTFRLELGLEMAAKVEQDARWRLEATGIQLP